MERRGVFGFDICWTVNKNYRLSAPAACPMLAHHCIVLDEDAASSWSCLMICRNVGISALADAEDYVRQDQSSGDHPSDDPVEEVQS